MYNCTAGKGLQEGSDKLFSMNASTGTYDPSLWRKIAFQNITKQGDSPVVGRDTIVDLLSSNGSARLALELFRG